MIKLSDKHQYMTITSNGFILLYNHFSYNGIGKIGSNGPITVLSNELIFIQKIYYTPFSNITQLYNHDFNNLSIDIPSSLFNTLEKNCKNDLINYHYVKENHYIYKVPNLKIFSKHFKDLNTEHHNQLMLSYHFIKLYLIKDCALFIMPPLFNLIRLDYDAYTT